MKPFEHWSPHTTGPDPGPFSLFLQFIGMVAVIMALWVMGAGVAVWIMEKL